MKIYLVLLIAVLPCMLWAQSRKLTDHYKKGIQAFENENFKEAEKHFEYVKKNSRNNPYYENAYYFSALIYFQQKKYENAESSLGFLLQHNQKWENIEEAYYILANIAFEKKEDHIALSYLQGVKKAALQKDINSLKGFYLSKRSIETLKNLQNVYPKDPYIAQLLVDKLAAESSNINDLALIDYLVSTFKLSAPEKTKIKKLIKERKRNINRDTLNVVFLLPLHMKTFKSPDQRESITKLSVDLYQGARVAKRQLDTMGIFLNLKVYDVFNNPDTLDLYWKKGEFYKADLLVGPAYEEDFNKALQIAKSYNLTIINPFFVFDKTLNNPEAFTLASTTETQARQSAQFAFKEFKGKKVIIFHSELPDDIALAKLHQEEATSLKQEVVSMQKLSVANIAQIGNILSKVESKDLGYVFVASASATAAKEILAKMAELHPEVPILTTDAWRTIQGLSMEQFEEQNVHFIEPDYVRQGGREDPFRVAYNTQILRIQKYSNMQNPSLSAYKGYDLMMSFGKILYQKKVDIEKYIPENDDFKNTYRGYIYTTKKHDNQYVPIVKFVDKKMVLVNPL